MKRLSLLTNLLNIEKYSLSYLIFVYLADGHIPVIVNEDKIKTKLTIS